MIELKVKDYCHYCPLFEPVNNEMYSDLTIIVNVVHCRDKDRCDAIENFLRNRLAKEAEEKEGE